MSEQIPLFSNRSSFTSKLMEMKGWPDPNRFPTNILGASVGKRVIKDIIDSDNALIVTGYASLDKIINVLSDTNPRLKSFRLLLGTEPYNSTQTSFVMQEYTFEKEVKEYWYKKGISPRYSAKIIRAIELIDSGIVKVGFVDNNFHRLHAKIYCTDVAATLGSSNFSQNGFYNQLEANTRFDYLKDKRRYKETYDLAENYWGIGTDFTNEFRNLLMELLCVVDWKEALVRACIELLEGEWAEEYLKSLSLEDNTKLWPSQRAGIAQALWVLDNVGSVLIADATGSGKTRMGAYLLRAAMDRIWSGGRKRHGMPVLTVPAQVVNSWNRETGQIGLPIRVHSHSVLNRCDSEQLEIAAAEVKKSQLLGVDEAHNFINKGSLRTKTLLGNMADHVVLFTATPINRGPQDLLSLLNMLGADNLEEEAIVKLESLLRKTTGRSDLDLEELGVLKDEIRRFTVRRTKSALNEMVDRHPEEYKNINNELCRYPKHNPKQYDTDESEGDIRIATEIASLTKELKGFIFMEKCFEMPLSAKFANFDEDKFLSGRLKAASALSAYYVKSSMRSSKAALIEHLCGTAVAINECKINSNKHNKSTGDVIHKVLLKKNELPENRLSVELPDWLTDMSLYNNACDRESEIYTAIFNLAKKLSTKREEGKAKKLFELLNEHELILAFDQKLITLDVIQQLLENQLDSHRIHIATGSDVAGKKRVNRIFKIGSHEKRHIALCSDAMSEGVNLQQASAIVNLDIPSTVRYAEQRVGRVDRMDSPHKEIEAWWPRDDNAFALGSDDKFVQRYKIVELLLGSNMPLPDNMYDSSNYDVQTVINDAEKASMDAPWDEVEDAFKEVRNLVKGQSRIIPAGYYNEMSDMRSRVISRVSLVKSNSPWAFFCVSGNKLQAPKWVLFKNYIDKPITKLHDIAFELRLYLTDDISDIPIDKNAQNVINSFLDKLQNTERHLLTMKKQRALDEMELIFTAYTNKALKNKDYPAIEVLELILKVLKNKNKDLIPDWNQIAEKWLDLVRPIWLESLSLQRGKRLMMLKDIRKKLINNPLPISEIKETFKFVSTAPNLESQIVSAIIGVN